MKINSSYLMLLLTLAAGCSEIERVNNVKNPTEYVFQVSDHKIKTALSFAFEHLKYKSLRLFSSENQDTPSDTLEIFRQPGNHNDFYLSPTSFVVGKSFIYKKDGKGLDYVTSFHLHLEPLDSNRTKVTIITIRPRVILGKKILPSVHFVRPFSFQRVEPSTIEEYEILLKIGQEVKEPNMPEIIYP